MKCDTCGKPCEIVNMVGINNQSDEKKHEQHEKIKNKEYCDECFIPIAQKFGLVREIDIQSEEALQIAN